MSMKPEDVLRIIATHQPTGTSTRAARHDSAFIVGSYLVDGFNRRHPARGGRLGGN